MVKLKIDNYEVEATAGTSILEAARSVHIEIPTLCKHPDVDATAGCGIFKSGPKKTPTVGNRISILTSENAVETDKGLNDVAVVLPADRVRFSRSSTASPGRAWV